MIVVWLAVTFAVAVAASLLITPLVIRSAGALRLYDAPDGARRLHELPVPRLGGVAVYLGSASVAIGALIVARNVFLAGDGHPDRFLVGVFLGSAFLFLVGLIDDVRGLTPGAKLTAQIIAALIAYYFGARIVSLTVGYGMGVQVGMLSMPIAILWIVGVTNAYNFIDGLNGLAGGIALVACATIVIVAIALGNTSVLIPAMALGGALLAFLHFNYPRARVFLGDSGSLSVGFLLAVLSMKAAEVPGPSILAVVPILALSVPLLDAFLAILRRWLRSVPLSGADARHIHHRLLALGLSRERTAAVLWSLAVAMAAFGLLIALTAPFVAASIAILGLVGMSVLLIYGTNLLSYHEFLVAGEVLFSAPSRARRVISDQILALDVIGQIQVARGFEEVSAILANTASRFGFLRMELSGEHIPTDRTSQPDEWAWKLEYPLRVGISASTSHSYVLAIWCSAEYNVRPYGAERAARILAPALEQWLLIQHGGEEAAKHYASKKPAATRVQKRRV